MEVQVSLPEGQLALPRTGATISSSGVVFVEPDYVTLSVGTASMHVTWSPAGADGQAARDAADQRARVADSHPRSPAPLPQERPATAERSLGCLGEIRAYRTRTGRLVAEVEFTVNAPAQSSASRLGKSVAFGPMAEPLQRDDQPGHRGTAAGIPHELKRRSRVGQESTERQLSFVQPPKVG